MSFLALFWHLAPSCHYVDVGEVINKTLAKKTYFRILLLSMLLFGVVNFGIFGGQIVSTSVVQDQGHINSLQDLLGRDDYNFYMSQGTFMQHLLKTQGQQLV